MSELSSKRCEPCEGGVPPLSPGEAAELLQQIPGWRIVNDHELFREYEFPDFVRLISFINQMAEISESEGHHPNFSAAYNKLQVQIWTHAIDGLSENDFILAAKLDQIPR